MSSVMSLQEENRVLQGELARLEDLLAHSRADRDELAIKYGAISERVRTTHSEISPKNPPGVQSEQTLGGMLLYCSPHFPPFCVFSCVFVSDLWVSQVMGAGMA